MKGISANQSEKQWLAEDFKPIEDPGISTWLFFTILVTVMVIGSHTSPNSSELNFRPADYILDYNRAIMTKKNKKVQKPVSKS